MPGFAEEVSQLTIENVTGYGFVILGDDHETVASILFDSYEDAEEARFGMLRILSKAKAISRKNAYLGIGDRKG